MLFFLLSLALAAPDHVPHTGDVVSVDFGSETATAVILFSTPTQVGIFYESWSATGLPDELVIVDCVCEHEDAPLYCATGGSPTSFSETLGSEAQIPAPKVKANAPTPK